MSKKSWKDYVLSSGLPLEYSVVRVLEELGVFRPREFRYERVNEQGLPTQFSVDVHGTHHFPEKNLFLELLIECKYRHEGTKWVFTPSEYGWFSRPKFRDVFVRLDQIDKKRQLDGKLLNKFADRYVLCSKGVEILPKDSSLKTIEQALQQLRYAVVEMAVSSVRSQIGDRLGTDPDPIFVLVPIIVTTAELWRLKSETTIEIIRAAQDLDDVAERRNIFILHKDADNLLKRHIRHAFHNGLTDEEKETLNEALKAVSIKAFGKQSHWYTYEGLIDTFSYSHPSLFVVIHYSRFREAMSNLLDFFKRSDLIKPRETGQ